MLRITVPAQEFFDEETCKFITIKEQTLQLEHSLVSLAKWESKWHKPFISKEKMTREQALDYIRCMTITQNVNELVYHGITTKQFEQIEAYMNDSMSATWFSNNPSGPQNREILTAEIFYHWMIELNIPFKCEKWHLNRLLTLIKVRNIKGSPQTKMSKKELAEQNRAINAARRLSMNSRG